MPPVRGMPRAQSSARSELRGLPAHAGPGASQGGEGPVVERKAPGEEGGGHFPVPCGEFSEKGCLRVGEAEDGDVAGGVPHGPEMLSRKKGKVRPGKKGLPGHPNEVGSLLPGFQDEAVHHRSVGDPGKLGSGLPGASVHPGLGLPLGMTGADRRAGDAADALGCHQGALQVKPALWTAEGPRASRAFLWATVGYPLFFLKP